MSIQRHDLRTQAPQKYGKPTISYPYGSTQYPRIVEVRTAKKGVESALLIPFLTPHRDRLSFPNALLTVQTADAGDDTDKNITETYETLPGPIIVEISADQDTGMPVLVAKQKRAATDIFAEGEIVPPELNVLSITAGNPGTVTLDMSGQTPAAHFLCPRQYVTIAGTGTALDGTQRVLAAPNDQQVTFAVNVASAAGAGGTLTPVNRVVRECKPTDNLNINVKIDSMIAAPDVTAYNESIANVWKEYSFPDFLEEIIGYRDLSNSTTSGLTEYAFTITQSGSYGVKVQNGYRGPCKATRYRLFGMGPAAIASALSGYNITLVIPSSGNVVVESQSISEQVTTGGIGTATSYTFKNGPIPPVITAGMGMPSEINGSGSAQFIVTLPASTPTGFTEGDTIYIVEQPQKLRCGLWQVYVWALIVPYTVGIGGAPANLQYTPNPATFAHGAPISNMSPSYTSGAPSSFSVSPSLPSGLTLDTTFGTISGTPASTTATATYTITATNTSGSTTCGLAITIT